MHSFLHNNLTWKSFLSSMSKNIKSNNYIHSWEMKGNTQLVLSQSLKEQDIHYLLNYNKFNTYYLYKNDIQLLEKYFKVSKSKENNVVIPLDNFSLVGNKYMRIRWAINHNSKKSLKITEDFTNYNEILEMLNQWNEVNGEKYFQSKVGKNKFFFKNNLHKEGISLFIYDNTKIIAFGVLSMPQDNTSSYVIGKTLCHQYNGLSEYIDVLLYEKAKSLGVKYIALGGGSTNVLSYKMKFPNAYIEETFDISCTKI